MRKASRSISWAAAGVTGPLSIRSRSDCSFGRELPHQASFTADTKQTLTLLSEEKSDSEYSDITPSHREISNQTTATLPPGRTE